MPIGDGPDYYNGINKEEDARVRLFDAIENWWNSLDEDVQQEILDTWFPGIVQSWDELPMEQKIEIWNENK